MAPVAQRHNEAQPLLYTIANPPFPQTDPVAQQNGALTVQGETVNAIIGGTLMHFVSPSLPFPARETLLTPLAHRDHPPHTVYSTSRSSRGSSGSSRIRGYRRRYRRSGGSRRGCWVVGWLYRRLTGVMR